MWKQVGLLDSCVGTSGNVTNTVWEQVGLWESRVGSSWHVSSVVWKKWDCG